MKAIAAALLLFLGSVIGITPLAAQAPAQLSESISAFDQAIENSKMAMMADPEEALGHSERALELAENQSGAEKDINRATALWLKSESLIGLNRLDEAGDIATEALEIVEKAAPDTKLNGDLLRSRGAVQALSGNVQDALTDYQAAHEIFRTAGITRSQAIALQDLGQIYWEAGDYERTLSYYEQAVAIYNDDPGFALSNHNNLGETYKMLTRFAEAEEEYAKAIEAAKELGSPMLETRILSNLALVQIEQDKLVEARQTTNRALRLARNGDAADWRDFVYGVQARIAFEQGSNREAARYLDLTFAGADFETTDLVYREFHELGATVFDQIGQPTKALAHLRAFQRLDSQARDLVASASSQLMAAQFDFANQNLEISQLKQGQLERDIQLERQRSEFRTMAFGGFTAAITIVMVLVLIAFFSIRRSRNEVRAANTQLTVVNSDLEHALKAKTDFLAMTSHEIRTPLNGILGTSQVLMANRGIDTDSMKRVKLIHNAGQTMKALVDDLLDVAKMESGEVGVELAPAPVRTILQDAGLLWSDKLKEKNLAFHQKLDDLPDLIETDGDRLRQIVFNLLSNAVKFTREGSVTLEALADRESDRLVIAISDSGVGIPEAEQKEIFEAFHQVDNATTREFSGTGLGLPICKNLASALGGRIEVESTVGQGSTFRLILPLNEIETDVAVSGQRPHSLAECRICLIEANPMKQAILTGLLEPHVKSVLAFGEASECEDTLDNGSIDHVVFDAAAVATDTDGVGVLRDFLTKANSQEVATTVLFAPDGPLPLEEVSRLGHSQLLIKPIGGDALIAALTEHYTELSEPEATASQASAA